jgi:hypothetical protein
MTLNVRWAQHAHTLTIKDLRCLVNGLSCHKACGVRTFIHRSFILKVSVTNTQHTFCSTINIFARQSLYNRLAGLQDQLATYVDVTTAIVPFRPASRSYSSLPGDISADFNTRYGTDVLFVKPRDVCKGGPVFRKVCTDYQTALFAGVILGMLLICSIGIKQGLRKAPWRPDVPSPRLVRRSCPSVRHGVMSPSCDEICVPYLEVGCSQPSSQCSVIAFQLSSNCD